VWKTFGAAVLISVGAGPTAARTPADVTTTYFADSAKTKWVGEIELTCGGGVIKFGHTSSFYKKSKDSCSKPRMSPIAFGRLGGTVADKIAACYFRCGVRYGHRPPQLCTPEGCPGNEALSECNASCDELGQSERGR